MDEYIPQLTLTPDLSAQAQPEVKKEEDLITKAQAAPEAGPDLSALSPAEQQAVLSLGGQVLDFSAGGSYCAVLTGTGLTVYDPDMEQASSMQSTMGARRVDMGADGTAVLADSQRAWLYIPG